MCCIVGPLSGYVLYYGAAVWALSVVSVVLWGRCMDLVNDKHCTVSPCSHPTDVDCVCMDAELSLLAY